jgi:excisionase family DNA binding protein
MGRKISMAAAAEWLDVDHKTIRRLIGKGDIPAYRIGKRLVRIDIDELETAFKPIQAPEQLDGDDGDDADDDEEQLDARQVIRRNDLPKTMSQRAIGEGGP